MHANRSNNSRQCSVGNETKAINVARLRYKAAFDAYWAIAKRNADLVKNGGKPSDQERANEERAALDLQTARDELTNSTTAGLAALDPKRST
jgi:hypothetical protein